MSKESALALMNQSSPTPPPAVPEAQAPEAEPVSPPTETSGPEAVEKKQELSSTPFSHLAKKEAELVRQRQEFKKEQERIAQEKAKLLDVQKKIQAYEETKKTDPIAALKMIGFSETDIFNYIAAQEKKEPTPEEKAALAAAQAAEEKIKAFEESQQKKLEAEQKARDEQIIQTFKGDLSQAVKSNPEKYEYCHYHGAMAEELMYETAVEIYKQTEEVISPEEAAELVESYYESQDEAMNQLKKRVAKSQAMLSTSPKEEASAQPAQRTRTVTPGYPADPASQPKPSLQRVRTLTNAATSTVASTRLKMNETREQKRERLMDILRNGK